MARPFKFRFVNQIAGTFVGFILIIVVVGVVLVGRAQKWFHPGTELIVLLPEQGSFGLKVGGEVRMMGVTIGSVDHINPPTETSDRMTTIVHVDPVWAKFIRSGLPDGSQASHAVIRLPLVLGDPFIEFSRGQGKPAETDTKFIADPDTSATDAATKMVADLQTKTLPAVQALVQQYTLLAMDLRSQQGPVQQTLAHLDQLTANLQRTDTVLGKLTADKPLADQLSVAVERMTASTDELQKVLGDLQKTSGALPNMAGQGADMMTAANKAITNVNAATTQLPAVMASLKQTVDALPGVMIHTQQSLVEVEKLVRGMQALPLIRDHVEQASDTGPLKPTDVGAN